MRRLVAAFAIALAVAPVGAQTDSIAQWPVEARVRIRTTNNRTVIGQLTEVRGDTLIVRKEGALFRPWTKILADSAGHIEVSRSRYISAERVAWGALAGAAGMVLTYVVMDAVMPDVCVFGSCEDSSPDYVRAGALGAAAGALSGVLYLADRWEGVPKPLRVGFAPARGQARIALSFAFR